jgi:hypothetical protein
MLTFVLFCGFEESIFGWSNNIGTITTINDSIDMIHMTIKGIYDDYLMNTFKMFGVNLILPENIEELLNDQSEEATQILETFKENIIQALT